MTPTRDVVAVVALAASLAALLARAIAGALESIDRELSSYCVEIPVTVPAAWVETDQHVHGAWCHPSADGCPDDLR